jgi:hypothetical protein
MGCPTWANCCSSAVQGTYRFMLYRLVHFSHSVYAQYKSALRLSNTPTGRNGKHDDEMCGLMRGNPGGLQNDSFVPAENVLKRLSSQQPCSDCVTPSGATGADGGFLHALYATFAITTAILLGAIFYAAVLVALAVFSAAQTAALISAFADIFAAALAPAAAHAVAVGAGLIGASMLYLSCVAALISVSGPRRNLTQRSVIVFMILCGMTVPALAVGAGDAVLPPPSLGDLATAAVVTLTAAVAIVGGSSRRERAPRKHLSGAEKRKRSAARAAACAAAAASTSIPLVSPSSMNALSGNGAAGAPSSSSVPPQSWPSHLDYDTLEADGHWKRDAANVLYCYIPRDRVNEFVYGEQERNNGCSFALRRTRSSGTSSFDLRKEVQSEVRSPHMSFKICSLTSLRRMASSA